MHGRGVVLLVLVASGCGLVLDLTPDDRRDASTSGMDGGVRDGGGPRDAGADAGDAGKPCDASSECEDGIACNGVADCVGGQCQDGIAPGCDDGIDCTVDSCDEALGCVSAPNDALCPDDGMACTVEQCTAGAGCTVALSDVACDDTIACTIDSCDPSTGCTHATDDSRCGGTATCVDGVGCMGEECAVEGDCTSLLGPCHDSVSCVAGACVFVDLADGTSCGDDNPCAVPGSASCIGGECRGMRTSSCPGMPCVTCDIGGGGCDGSMVRTGPCTDADPCTHGSTCQPDGSCRPLAATTCIPSSPCTTSMCDGAGGCLEPAVPDGTPCPTGRCMSGMCIASTVCRSDQVVCDDGNCCPTLCGHCISGGGCEYCNPDEFNCPRRGDICVSRSAPETECPGGPYPTLCGCRCNPDLGETCCETMGTGTCCPAGDPTCCS